MTVVLDVTCRARVHDTTEAHQVHGCVCPVAFGVPYRPPHAPWRRWYVKGDRRNVRGPRRCTVQEPDWVAVERSLSGDRSLVLAAVERDDAIDRLDRHGLSAAEVARRLGITKRTVQRRRSARRGAA